MVIKLFFKKSSDQLQNNKKNDKLSYKINFLLFFYKTYSLLKNKMKNKF